MNGIHVQYRPEALRGDAAVARCLDALSVMYASSGRGAVVALRPVLAETFTFTPAGTDRSVLQANYRGPEGFARFLEQQAALTADTWWPQLQSVLVKDDEIVADVIARPRRLDGLRAQFRIEHHWAWHGDEITRFHSRTLQQEEYDRFHAQTADELHQDS